MVPFCKSWRDFFVLFRKPYIHLFAGPGKEGQVVGWSSQSTRQWGTWVGPLWTQSRMKPKRRLYWYEIEDKMSVIVGYKVISVHQ